MGLMSRPESRVMRAARLLGAQLARVDLRCGVQRGLLRCWLLSLSLSKCSLHVAGQETSRGLVV